MTNKILRIPLLFALFLAMSITAKAYTCEIDGIYYNLSDGIATVTYYEIESHPYYGDVVIPETITYDSQEYPVTSIGNNAFAYCVDMTSVTIPNSVTTIGSFAFEGCTGLTSITIPNSVTYIGNFAFYGCEGLTKVTLDSNVIVSKTYSSSSSLKSVFGNQVQEYIIGESVTSIGNYAFAYCGDMTSVTFPNSVTTISDSAFLGCTGLTSVTIPNSVTSIDNWAFQNCENLKTIYIGDNVSSLGGHAFLACKNAKFYVKRGTPSLLNLWRGSLDYSEEYIVPYERGTENLLMPPTLTVKSTTQTTATVEVSNIYKEYSYTASNSYTAGNSKLNGNEIVVRELRPESSVYVWVDVSLRSVSYRVETTATTKSLNLKVSPTAKTASSLLASLAYTEGDVDDVTAEIAVCKVAYDKMNGSNHESGYWHYKSADTKKENGRNVYYYYFYYPLKEIQQLTKEKTFLMTGLEPGKSSCIVYKTSIKCGKEIYSDTKVENWLTEDLSLKTLQPKVVSMGNVVVSAESNLDDVEENVGFEWRRTDWTSEFASNTGLAYMYEGTMEGYIRNLYYLEQTLWKYRPYYVSDAGTYYYGDWVGIDPTNTSWFEPTVHTYAKVGVDGNSAVINGYVQVGSDKIRVQGFKYWKLAAASTALADFNETSDRRNAPKIPTGAATIEASGRVMEADLSGLDYNSTYAFVAFATTDEGDTYYGEQQEFTTGAAPTGIETIDNSQFTIDNDTQAGHPSGDAWYTLGGQRLQGKPTAKGIYIRNGRKVLIN